jgi:hypothetical protein
MRHLETGLAVALVLAVFAIGFVAVVTLLVMTTP